MSSSAEALIALPTRVARPHPQPIELRPAAPRFGVRHARWADAAAAAALAAAWMLLWTFFLVGVVWPAARL